MSVSKNPACAALYAPAGQAGIQGRKCNSMLTTRRRRTGAQGGRGRRHHFATNLFVFVFIFICIFDYFWSFRKKKWGRACTTPFCHHFFFRNAYLVFVRHRPQFDLHTHTHTHTYIHIYISIYLRTLYSAATRVFSLSATFHSLIVLSFVVRICPTKKSQKLVYSDFAEQSRFS